MPKITAPRSLKAVGDNDEAFGLRVIETPGHTPAASAGSIRSGHSLFSATP